MCIRDSNKSGLDYEAGIQNKVTETHYVLGTEKELKSFIEHQNDKIWWNKANEILHWTH